MRVISGTLKGRRLASFEAGHIRPTTDRVKETIFNILMNDIPGARVLDLYAGTGNLGIEAFSRGAESVLCVESHKKSIGIIRKNLEQLGINDQIEVRNSDVFQFLKKYQGDPYTVIFADPPFTEALAHSTLEALSASAVLGTNTLVIIEGSRHERVDKEYSRLELLDQRDFGDKSAFIFRARDSHKK